MDKLCTSYYKNGELIDFGFKDKEDESNYFKYLRKLGKGSLPSSTSFQNVTKMMNSKERKKPLMKIDNKSIKMGSAVFLRPSNDVNLEYDKELEDLINAHHRFAVGIYFGPKFNTVAVHLLSTSKFMNQINRLGKKLKSDYGKYGNGKQVYIDSQKAWVIKKCCIESHQYDLGDDDVGLIENSLFTSTENQTKFIKGVLNNSIVDRDFEYYSVLNQIGYNYQQEIIAYRENIAKALNKKVDYNSFVELFFGDGNIPSNSYIFDYIKQIKHQADTDFTSKSDKDVFVKEKLIELIFTIPDDYIKDIVGWNKRSYK